LNIILKSVNISSYRTFCAVFYLLKNELIESLESMAAISEQSAASTEEINASTEEQLSRVTEIAEAIDSLNQDIVKLSNEMNKFNA
jgi:methyl-accepting chemotaxis protein